MRQDLDVRLLDVDQLTSPADRARLLAPQLKALSDPNRLHLLLLLAEGPRTVRVLSTPTRDTATTRVPVRMRPASWGVAASGAR